jgi:glycine cleavage system H protein
MTIFFTKDHEWVDMEGQCAKVGITHYGQSQLGDAVYVELPEVGKHLQRGGEVAVIDGVKAANEIYAPVSGRVIEVNAMLAEIPILVNVAAETDGWFVKVALKDCMELDGLMDEAAYQAYVEAI